MGVSLEATPSQARSIAQPFAYEEYRKNKIREKIEEERQNRVQKKVRNTITL